MSDLHSIYSQVLAATKYQMAVAANTVFANGSSVFTPMAGSGDVSFESFLSQIFFARSTSKKKFDGTTVRNWGIDMSGGTPTAVAAAGAAGGVVMDCNDGSDIVWEANDGGGREFTRGYGFTPLDRQRAAVLVCDPNTGQGTISQSWATDQDFSGPDDSVIAIRVRLSEYYRSVTLQFATEENSSAGDTFTAVWGFTDVLTDNVANPSTPGAYGNEIQDNSAQWFELKIRRSDMIRVGTTAGRGWDTIKLARVTIQNSVDTTHRYPYEPIYNENLGSGAGEWDATGTNWNFAQTVAAGTPDAYENGPKFADTLAVTSGNIGKFSNVARAAISLANKHLGYLYLNLRGNYAALQLKASFRTAFSRTPPNGDIQGREYLLDVAAGAGSNFWGAGFQYLDGTAVAESPAFAVALQLNLFGLPGGSARLIEGLLLTKAATFGSVVYIDRIALRPYNAHLLQGITIGGGNSLVGEYEWVYQYVYDNGTYVTKSGESAVSNTVTLDQQAGRVTIPADTDRDSQIAEVWLFRRGGNLDQYYRTQVYDLSPFSTGTFDIDDTLSDQGALDEGITLEESNGLPPDDIIGIAGPYYDRIYALTETTLWPSRRLAPEVFASTQAIQVGGTDERALWVKRAYDGLYIGTTKDIYRLDGTGAEYPDATLEFTKTPLNVDHPPISSAVAAEGNLFVYLASDGWRVFTGLGSQSISGMTSKLYRGEARHGVSAVNLLTGRFRAAIAHGQLVIITPEGASATSSPVLYRYVFATQRWYRHTYGATAFRCIFREPDETLIAGDADGNVWNLDSGVDIGDDGDDIAVVLRTICENDLQPYSPKQSVGLSVNFDSAGDTATVDVHLDESDTAAESLSAVGGSILSPVALNTSAMALWTALQLRITGSFTRFRFSGFTVPYQGLPMAMKAWDSGPMDLGQQDLVWARHIQIKCRATADLTVTPYFDGVAFTPVTITVPADRSGLIGVFDVPVGRGYFGTIPRLVVESDSDFHPFWVEFLVRQTTESSDKPNIRIPSGLGGEAEA